MKSRRHSHGITHSLTPFLEEHQRALPEYEIPEAKARHYTPLYKHEQHYNPHKQRSRKHRLVE